MFVKRELVDQYVYAALPYGPIDRTRMPLSKTMDQKGVIQGQVRICCNPQIFMRATFVRMFTYSADPTFHKNREAFQDALTYLLYPILGSDDVREDAARGIMGGELPAWYSSEDQSEEAKVINHFK